MLCYFRVGTFELLVKVIVMVVLRFTRQCDKPFGMLMFFWMNIFYDWSLIWIVISFLYSLLWISVLNLLINYCFLSCRMDITQTNHNINISRTSLFKSKLLLSLVNQNIFLYFFLAGQLIFIFISLIFFAECRISLQFEKAETVFDFFNIFFTSSTRKSEVKNYYFTRSS